MDGVPQRVEGDVIEPGVVLYSASGEEHGAVEVVDETGATHVLHASGPEGELLQRLGRGSSLAVTAVALGHSGERNHLLVHSIDELAAETPYEDHAAAQVVQAVLRDAPRGPTRSAPRAGASQAATPPPRRGGGTSARR